MTLREKQSRFAQLVARLLIEIDLRGYEVTFGEAWRSPEEAKRHGNPKSLHTQRLAVDLNLFKDGVYLRSTEAHRPFGEWWEMQSEPEQGIECCWGGHFNDGNHYSIAHGGRK